MICFEGGMDLMEFVFVFCFLEMIERMILILRCDYDAIQCFLTGLEFWYNQFFSICIFEFFCSRESCFLIPAILLVVNRN